MRNILFSLSLIALTSCSSMMGPKTPDFYPNEKLQKTSRSEVQSDVNSCLGMADDYIKEPNKYANMAKYGLVGGAVGAGTGAVAGTITGNAGRGTGAGAAVGGMLGVLKGLSEMNERSPSYERFVEHCLQKKGYEITGWSAK